MDVYMYMIRKHNQLGKNRVYKIGNMGQHFVKLNTGKPWGVWQMCLCVKDISFLSLFLLVILMTIHF